MSQAVAIHDLGFPHIGARRELKFALESYWKGESSRDSLKQLGTRLHQRRWTEVVPALTNRVAAARALRRAAG